MFSPGWLPSGDPYNDKARTLFPRGYHQSPLSGTGWSLVGFPCIGIGIIFPSTTYFRSYLNYLYAIIRLFTPRCIEQKNVPTSWVFIRSSGHAFATTDTSTFTMSSFFKYFYLPPESSPTSMAILSRYSRVVNVWLEGLKWTDLTSFGRTLVHFVTMPSTQTSVRRKDARSPLGLTCWCPKL